MPQRRFVIFWGVASLGRDSPRYVDVFAWRLEKKGKLKEEVYDGIIIYDLGQRLTHEILWKLTTRLRDTLYMPVAGQGMVASLKDLDFAKVSNFRNNILYDGATWLNSDAISECDLTTRLSNVRLLRAIRDEQDLEQEIAEYFHIASAMGAALVYLFRDLAELAPDLKSEVVALTDWRDPLAA